MRARTDPIRGLPLALGVAVGCLAANALAVATLDPLSLQNLGPLALVYHDREPDPVLVPVLVVLVLLAQRVRGSVRVPLLVFVGAAAANLLSSEIWHQGVPDYLVVARFDVVANVPDAVVACSVCAVAAGMALDVARRGDRRRASRDDAGPSSA